MAKRVPKTIDGKDTRTIARRALAIMHRDYPGKSDETILFRPTDAMALCEKVRESLSIHAEDEQILRTIVNERKRGRVNPAETRHVHKANQQAAQEVTPPDLSTFSGASR